jgi:hypothetical protein
MTDRLQQTWPIGPQFQPIDERANLNEVSTSLATSPLFKTEGRVPILERARQKKVPALFGDKSETYCISLELISSIRR